jgi:hypothetical protein
MIQAPGNSYLGGRLSTVDLRVLTTLETTIASIIYSFTKQAILMWWPAVLSLPLQLMRLSAAITLKTVHDKLNPVSKNNQHV